MKISLFICNPHERSLSYNFLDHVVKALDDVSLRPRIFDLYKMPKRYLLNQADMRHYNDGQVYPDLMDIMALLKDTETLILIFPVWMYGLPSLLKGLLERLIRPGLTFDIRPDGVRPLLTNIKRFIVICSSGQADNYPDPHHDPVRHSVYHLMRDNFSPDCDLTYLRLFGVDHLKAGEVEAFGQRIETAILEIGKTT